MKKHAHHSPATIRKMRGLGVLTVFTMALAAVTAPAARAQTAQTMTRVIHVANDGGDASLRGGLVIDIAVDPGNLAVPIRDLHLLVAISQHSNQEGATLHGDRKAGNYRDLTANMPTGWQYAGLIAVPNRAGQLLWFATWHCPRGKGLQSRAKFSLLYSGDRPVVMQPGSLVITSVGNVDPRMGQVAVLAAHAPK
jgi:hypothetical protein